MKFLKEFGDFWYDFIIGDDWKIAVAVVLALGATTLLLLTGAFSDHVLVTAARTPRSTTGFASPRGGTSRSSTRTTVFTPTACWRSS